MKGKIDFMSGIMEQDINEAVGADFAGHHHGHGQGGYRQWFEPSTKVRKDFPETWIWTNVTVG